MDNSKEKLGLFTSVCILVGGCIGSAIFSLSGMTMYYAGPASILSWIIAGLIQGSYGIQVAELSVRYPHSGGVYVFPSKALSPFWGFIASWGYIIANFIAVAFAAIYVGTYLSVSFAFFSGYRTLLAVITILFCALLNEMKITNTGKFNNILVGFLVLTMLIFSIVSFSSTSFNVENFTPFFYGAKGKFGFLEAVPNAMVGYGSVVGIAFMVGEVKKPNRTVPLSMLIAMCIVMALYITIIVATLGHITIPFLIENPGMRFIPLFASVWTSMADKLWLTKLISISAFFALITTMIVVQYLNALAIRAMANDKKLPRFLAYSNGNNAPIGGILLSAVVSILLSLRPSWTETLVNLASLTACITIIIVISSLIRSRRVLPYKDGNYKAFGGNILSYVVISLILLCYIPSFFSKNVPMWCFTIGVYLVGICVYLSYANLQKKNNTPLYVLSGTVVHGKGMGRTVGMPTANIDIKTNEVSIPFGVYSTTINIDGETFLAVTNVGTRPSVDMDAKVTVEAHIIDFDRDIYDKIVSLNFYKKIRDIQKFPSLSDVKSQVDKDIEFTKKSLSCV